MTKTRLTILLAAAAAALPLATTPAARAEGTEAVVVNERDDSEVYRLMLQIRRAIGDTVDTTNAAVAVASCESCTTVAVSIQALLVMSSPSIFTPENLALAMNIDCDFCQTLASAYQTIFQTGGPVRLTAEGSRRVAELRQELEALRNSGLSIFEIQERVDAINDELVRILSTEVEPAGAPQTDTTAPDGGEQPAGTQSAPTDTGQTTSSETGTTPEPTQTETTPEPTETGTSTAPSESDATGATGPSGATGASTTDPTAATGPTAAESP